MMKNKIVFTVVAFTVLVSGCAAFTANSVLKTVLSAGEIACVLATRETDEQLVAKLCAVQEAAWPSLRDLLVGKARAAKARAARDGGVEGGCQ